MAADPPSGGGGGFLAKSGLDSIKIGGKKVPIALIGGLAAVIGVILVIRARSSGSTTTLGNAPAAANTGVNPVVDYGAAGFSPDYSAALANLNQQLTGVENSLANQQATPPPVTPSNPTPNTQFAAGDFAAVPSYQGLDYKPGGSEAAFNQGGYTYFHLADPTQALAYEQGGGVAYYFPQPGVAVANPGAGTFQYGRVPQVPAA